MTPSIFPCWGRHERMGHNHVVGRFESFVGSAVLCTVPDLPGDEDHEPVVGGQHVLPMDGPAFYGFTVLPEERAMATLMAARPRIYRPCAPLLAVTDPDVEEVDDEDDDGCDCRF